MKGSVCERNFSLWVFFFLILERPNDRYGERFAFSLDIVPYLSLVFVRTGGLPGRINGPVMKAQRNGLGIPLIKSCNENRARMRVGEPECRESELHENADGSSFENNSSRAGGLSVFT